MSYVNHKGTLIQYAVEGAGPPLVLHHGMSENIMCWHHSGMVEALRRQYRLIMFDARGHGGSDKPHNAADYTLACRTMDVVQFTVRH